MLLLKLTGPCIQNLLYYVLLCNYTTCIYLKFTKCNYANQT